MLTQEAIDILNKVKAYIMEEPKRLNMSWWGKRKRHVPYYLEDEVPPCGTVCCIAGTIYLLEKMEELTKLSDAEFYDSMLFTAEKYAAYKLALNTHENAILFCLDYWPEEFRVDYKKAEEKKDFSERAKVTCERIDHFIATGE